MDQGPQFRSLHSLRISLSDAMDQVRNLDAEETAPIGIQGDASKTSTYNTKVAALRTGLTAVLTTLNEIDAIVA
jgi:hypothetical protein